VDVGLAALAHPADHLRVDRPAAPAAVLLVEADFFGVGQQAFRLPMGVMRDPGAGFFPLVIALVTGLLAFLALAIVLCLVVVRSKIGHVLVAIRENENRTAMLGYDVKRYKLIAFVLSGSFAAFSGAAYALLFAYAGSTLASIQYSINPLLWTLLGGAATVLGPVLGTALMFLLVDFASGFTSASLLFVGVVLILLVLFFPKGILGTIRQRWWRWLQGHAKANAAGSGHAKENG